MARPRKWASDAERMRAKRAADAGVTIGTGPQAVIVHREPELDEPLGEELVEFDGELRPIVRHFQMTEDEYVELELAVTRSQDLKDPDVKKLGPGYAGSRLERCEAYARRRYRGAQVGEITGP